MKQNLILGSAHITGGGLSDNISRILPDHLKANIVIFLNILLLYFMQI